MLKFFAKYNKIILVVGGSLLMVIFLLPAGGRFLQPDPGNQTIGRVDGTKITLREQQEAAAEIELVNRLLPQLQGALPHDALHWLLLVKEARKNGLYVAAEQVHPFLDQMAANGVNVAAMLQANGASVDFAVQALQHLEMIEGLSRLITAAEHPSEPRLAHFAQDIHSTATADVVGIDADFLGADAPKPTNDDIQKLFAEYKDDIPGRSEPYGFGYRLPARVKLEYLSVPLKRVANSITVDEVEAQKYYATHPEDYMPAPAADEKKDDKAAAPKEPLPYRQVRDRVIAAVTDKMAKEKQDRIVKQIVAMVAEHNRQLKRDEQNYLILTPEHTPLAYETITQQIQKDFGVLLDVIRVEGRWLTFSDIRKLEGFGGAGFEMAGKQVNVLPYIASIKQFDPNPANPLVNLRLQVNVSSRAVSDGAGNQYIFRVLVADPAHEPKLLDEVLDDVTRDAKRLAAYNLLKDRTDKILERVKTDGLDKVAEAYKTKVEKVGPFSGRDQQTMMMSGGKLEVPTLPVVGKSKAFVEQVFDMCQKAQTAGGIAKAPADQTLAVIPIDTAQKVVIVKLVSYEPIDEGTYERLKPMFARGLIQSNATALTADYSPLTLDALKKRLNYVSAHPEKDKEVEEKQATTSGDAKAKPNT
ncbi:MAG: hypothetical protein GC162_06145 [Planctomycetes bacterium]|nr:hypothetical protein [Planctomycetota bacterium]